MEGRTEASRAGVAWAFERLPVTVAFEVLQPLKTLAPEIKRSAKYRQIAVSIKAVGLVEPPVICPDTDRPGAYFIVDGHLRIEVLKDLGATEVACLVSKDDEAFTYNKRVNRLSPPQEHLMIVRAIERGVPEERLAEALGINVGGIHRRVRLLDGIDAEAAEILRDAPCPLGVFDILRKMGPLRQREAAELMVGHSNYGRSFATALLAATPDNQLAAGRKRRSPKTSEVTREQVARLERELATLQVQIKEIEETYGLDNLHLTVAKGYLTKLLGNAPVVRWLSRNRPEYLSEFQKISELTSLPAEVDEAAE